MGTCRSGAASGPSSTSASGSGLEDAKAVIRPVVERVQAHFENGRTYGARAGGRSVDGLVTGEYADDALVEASGKDEAFTPVGLGMVPGRSASSGIGKAAAIALATAGFEVIGTGRDTARFTAPAGVTYLDLDESEPRREPCLGTEFR